MVELTWFETHGKVYKLKTPISLTLTQDESNFYAEKEEYIIGIGDTEKESIEDARETLGRMYEWKFETELPLPIGILDWLEKIDALIEE